MKAKTTAQSQNLIRLPEVERRVGVSGREIYRRVSAGNFPRPVKIGTRSIAWIEAEIDAYVETKIAGRDARPA